METRNARIGLIFFIIYLVLYGGFVLINAFSPETMEITPLEGVNLAILYGFGLIIVALLLALLYGWMCHPVESAVDLAADVQAADSGDDQSHIQRSDA